jgi:hypothetical protein
MSNPDARLQIDGSIEEAAKPAMPMTGQSPDFQRSCEEIA